MGLPERGIAVTLPRDIEGTPLARARVGALVRACVTVVSERDVAAREVVARCVEVTKTKRKTRVQAVPK